MFHFVYPLENDGKKPSQDDTKLCRLQAISKKVSRYCINFPHELTSQILTNQSILYKDLARAKGEALVSLIYIVYSSKMENSVMLSGDGQRKQRKKLVGLISKIAAFHVQHTFFLHFFAVFLLDYNAKLPETSHLHVLCVPVHFMFSLPLIFTLVAASISPFSHRRYKIFMSFFQQNWSPLFFIARSSSFCVIHVNVHIKIKSKERIGFVVVIFIA